jgi:lipopolysaccharide biosynthesis glycosyltransferase
MERCCGTNGLYVEFRPVRRELLQGITIYGHTGWMTYARLLLEDERLCEHRRVLYLDSDILVRGSIRELLYRVAGQEAPLLAVPEAGTPFVSSHGGVFNWLELGLRADQPYFNAGVLGIRLDLVREQSLFTSALRYLKTYDRSVISWDQGALNAVVGGRVSYIESKWNFTTSHLSRQSPGVRVGANVDAAAKRAVIAHFTGSGQCKPWHVNSSSPFRYEYRALQKIAGYSFLTTSGLERVMGIEAARIVRGCYSAVAYEQCDVREYAVL